MKKETYYIQCALERKGYHHMAWIPERYAVLEKYIKIKQSDGSWEDGWQVKGVASETRKSTAEANAASQGHKVFGGSIK